MQSIIGDQWRIASTLGIGSDESPTSVPRQRVAVEHDDEYDDTATSLPLATTSKKSADKSTATKSELDGHATSDNISQLYDQFVQLNLDETDTVTEECDDDSSAVPTNVYGKRALQSDSKSRVVEAAETSGIGSEQGRTEADRLNNRGPGVVQARWTNLDGRPGVKYMRTAEYANGDSSPSVELFSASPSASNESVQQSPIDFRDFAANELQPTYTGFSDNCVQSFDGTASFFPGSEIYLSARKVLTSDHQLPYPDTTAACESYNFRHSTALPETRRVTDVHRLGDLRSALSSKGNVCSKGSSPVSGMSSGYTPVNIGTCNLMRSSAAACSGITLLAGSMRVADTSIQSDFGPDLSSSRHVHFNGPMSCYSACYPIKTTSSGLYNLVSLPTTAAYDVCDSGPFTLSQNTSVNIPSLVSDLSSSMNAYASSSNSSMQHPCLAVGTAPYNAMTPLYRATSDVDYNRSTALPKTTRVMDAPPLADFIPDLNYSMHLSCNGIIPSAFPAPRPQRTAGDGHHEFVASQHRRTYSDGIPSVSSIEFANATVGNGLYNFSTSEPSAIVYHPCCSQSTVHPVAATARTAPPITNQGSTSTSSTSANGASSHFLKQYLGISIGNDQHHILDSSSRAAFNAGYSRSIELPETTKVTQTPMLGDLNSDSSFLLDASSQAASSGSLMQYPNTTGDSDISSFMSASSAAAYCGLSALEDTTGIPDKLLQADFCTDLDFSFNTHCNGAASVYPLRFPNTTIDNGACSFMTSSPSVAANDVVCHRSNTLPETTTVMIAPPMGNPTAVLSNSPMSTTVASSFLSMQYPSTTIVIGQQNLISSSSPFNVDTRPSMLPDNTRDEEPLVDILDLVQDFFNEDNQSSVAQYQSAFEFTDQFTPGVSASRLHSVPTLMSADQRCAIERPGSVHRAPVTSSTSSVASTIYPEVDQARLTPLLSGPKRSVVEQDSRSYGDDGVGESTDTNNGDDFVWIYSY